MNTVKIYVVNGNIIEEYDKPITAKLPHSRYLSVKEFLANRYDNLDLAVVRRKFLDVLPLLREVGGPVVVTSVLRTNDYNEREGGNPNSEPIIFK